MKYLEFTFTTRPATEAVQDVLAAVLAEIGFDSFVHTDELDRPAIERSPNPEEPRLAERAGEGHFRPGPRREKGRFPALNKKAAHDANHKITAGPHPGQ